MAAPNRAALLYLNHTIIEVKNFDLDPRQRAKRNRLHIVVQKMHLDNSGNSLNAVLRSSFLTLKHGWIEYCREVKIFDLTDALYTQGN